MNRRLFRSLTAAVLLLAGLSSAAWAKDVGWACNAKVSRGSPQGVDVWGATESAASSAALSQCKHDLGVSHCIIASCYPCASHPSKVCKLNQPPPPKPPPPPHKPLVPPGRTPE